MRFIVIGAGDVGTNLAQKLYHEHDVALIDLSQRRLERAVNQFDIQTVIGNGYSPETLLQAGISTADYVIGVADVDEVNIAACLTAKLINPTAKRIARVRNTDLDLSLIHI